MVTEQHHLSPEARNQYCALEAAGIIAACCPGSYDDIAERLLVVLRMMGELGSAEQRTGLAWLMARSATKLDPDLMVLVRQQ